MRLEIATASALTLLFCGAAHAAPAAPLTPASCIALRSWQLPAANITYPTTGASVTAATWETLPGGDAAYCKVTGAIAPVDPAAPPINWEADLPQHWNGKLLQYGGGGYNGVIPRTAGRTGLGPTNGPVPLARGFVTFGGDSGHRAANTNDASFAKNAEALENYGYMHIRKTLDVVRPLTERAYGDKVRRVYFQGGSTGGREGMTAALRWPQSYDGIISNYGTMRFTGLRLWGAALSRALYDNNSAGWIAPDLVKAIAAHAIKTCDTLDGAADDLVSNPAACRSQSKALVEKFACKGEPAVDCLSPVQIKRTINLYHDGYELPYVLANGQGQYDGYYSLEGNLMQIGSERVYSEPVKTGPHAHHAARAYEFFTYFVNTDGKLDFRNFDINKPGRYLDRILALSNMIDATNPDLSAFAARGGKMIMVTGVEDPSVTPLGNAEIYEAIAKKAGSRADDFIRFFTLPGLAHGGGNFTPEWDDLGALDRWVEDGVPPVGQVMTDGTNSPTRGRTRPICPWPTYPRYNGVGNINEASNFRCAK